MKTQIKCSFAGENEHTAIIGVVQPTTQWNVDEYRLFIAATPFEWFLDLPGPSRIHGTSVELNEVREVEFGNFYVKDMATDTVLLSGDMVTKACPQNNIRLFRTNYSYPDKYTTACVETMGRRNRQQAAKYGIICADSGRRRHVVLESGRRCLCGCGDGEAFAV